MADKLKLNVVTPERQVVEADADEVQLPGELGYLGILPGHATLVTLLKTGILSYRSGGSTHAMAISSGFAEVANDVVSVLADLAEQPADIDAGQAERDRAQASEELKSAGFGDMEAIRTRLELAQARIEVARRPS
ncbi:MAG: ATP synthase F1 subunit epsilon [Acidobacteriota bacterium]|nr:ATP synthase F1 subunit epsilon [Acidobacteriota bacterium]